MRWINLDIVLGILIGLGASIVFASPWHWEHGLKDYQELLAGGMALAGAAAAVIAVMRQIGHAQEMEDERRRCKDYAARALMPHALSRLCRYAMDCCRALNEVADGTCPTPHSQLTFTGVPGLAPPLDAMATLKECIEFGSADIQDRLAQLIKHLQIHQVRLGSPEELFGDTRIGADWYYTLVLDSIEVYARSEMLFDYARRKSESDPGEPLLRNMQSVAPLCSYDDYEWAPLYEELSRRYQVT